MKDSLPLIRVQGSSQVSVAADTVIVWLELISEDPDYGKAMADSARKLTLLRGALPKAGIEVEHLKTESFHVGVERDYVEGIQTFRAYSVRHCLGLRLPFEPADLGGVLAAVAASEAKAQVSLYFTVADTERVKRQVLEQAVRNARDRAEVIARAAGQKLGAVHAIDYGHTEIVIRSAKHGLGEGYESVSLDLNPANIEVGDTVLVAWVLEGAE